MFKTETRVINTSRESTFGHAICDRCGHEMDQADHRSGFHNLTMVRFRAGYASLFGDGRKVECDLCDACLFALLGRYARIVEDDPSEAKAFGGQSGKLIEDYFDHQARRVYALYQTPFSMAEHLAATLREWIDLAYNETLKRKPVVEPPEGGNGGAK